MSNRKCPRMAKRETYGWSCNVFFSFFFQRFPTDKAYYVAKEILTTERTYKKDLEVLNRVSNSSVIFLMMMVCLKHILTDFVSCLAVATRRSQQWKLYSHSSHESLVFSVGSHLRVSFLVPARHWAEAGHLVRNFTPLSEFLWQEFCPSRS